MVRKKRKIGVWIDKVDDKHFDNAYAFGESVDELFDELSIDKGDALTRPGMKSLVEDSLKKAFAPEKVHDKHGLIIFRNKIAWKGYGGVESEIPVELHHELVGRRGTDTPPERLTFLVDTGTDYYEKEDDWRHHTRTTVDIRLIDSTIPVETGCMDSRLLSRSSKAIFNRIASDIVKCLKKGDS